MKRFLLLLTYIALIITPNGIVPLLAKENTIRYTDYQFVYPHKGSFYLINPVRNQAGFCQEHLIRIYPAINPGKSTTLEMSKDGQCIKIFAIPDELLYTRKGNEFYLRYIYFIIDKDMKTVHKEVSEITNDYVFYAKTGNELIFLNKEQDLPYFNEESKRLKEYQLYVKDFNQERQIGYEMHEMYRLYYFGEWPIVYDLQTKPGYLLMQVQTNLIYVTYHFKINHKQRKLLLDEISVNMGGVEKEFYYDLYKKWEDQSFLLRGNQKVPYGWIMEEINSLETLPEGF